MRQRLATTFFLFLAVALVVCVGAPARKASSAAPATMTAHQIAERNKPGVVMILTFWKTKVIVPEPQFDQDKSQVLQQRVLQAIQRGDYPRTREGVASAAIEELLTNFLYYVKPGRNQINKEVQTGAMGTGFIITPDGYIVTNAHVIYAEEDYLKRQLIQTALQEIIEKDVQDVIHQAGEMNAEVSEETMKRGINNVATYYLHFMQMGKVETQIYTEMGVAVPGFQSQQRGFGSDLRKRGEPIPGKDVAVLKIDKTNLPTVSIGDDSTISTGDPIYVIGYPGVATFHPLLAQESAIEPTLTSGLISARKNMAAGFEVLQTDAAITHGNSGGPAFNDKGEVIGIATFGSIDYQTGQEISGMNFLIPISVARQFLNEINVQPQQSRLTQLYQEGLALYEGERFSRALDKFREVNELNPGYPYVQKYISDSRAAIDAGRDRSTPVWIYVTAGSIVGAGVLLLIILLLIRRGRQNRFVPFVPPPRGMFPPMMGGGPPQAGLRR